MNAKARLKIEKNTVLYFVAKIIEIEALVKSIFL